MYKEEEGLLFILFIIIYVIKTSFPNKYIKFEPKKRGEFPFFVLMVTFKLKKNLKKIDSTASHIYQHL